VILALDVFYGTTRAFTAGVGFPRWDAEAATFEKCLSSGEPAPYRAGSFYERELPCLLGFLSAASLTPDCLIVDGYVDLAGSARPGLGRHLFERGARGAARAQPPAAVRDGGRHAARRG
jgi:deoxyribonuclease V